MENVTEMEFGHAAEAGGRAANPNGLGSMPDRNCNISVLHRWCVRRSIRPAAVSMARLNGAVRTASPTWAAATNMLAEAPCRLPCMGTSKTPPIPRRRSQAGHDWRLVLGQRATPAVSQYDGIGEYLLPGSARGAQSESAPTSSRAAACIAEYAGAPRALAIASTRLCAPSTR